MELYTVEEVAYILKLSKRTIYSYIEAGYIRAVQVGEKKAIRIPKDALEEFLKANQTTIFIVPLPRDHKA